MNNIVKKSPLVSICVPVYNNENYIAETIYSILHQTYSNIEIILVDDHSVDASLSHIKEEAQKALDLGLLNRVFDLADRHIYFVEGTTRDPANIAPRVDFDKSGIPALSDDCREARRTIYIYHNETNLGMAGNWNKCLSLCRGKYIKLICADDQIDPTLIAKEVALMEQYKHILLVQSDTVFLNDENKQAGSYVRYGHGVMDGKEIAKHSLFTRDYLGAPLANLIRASAYRTYGGFDPSFSYIIDYDFFMKLACHGAVYVLREPLNFFRLRNDSNTGQVFGGDKGESYVKEHIRLVEKYAKVLGLTKWQKRLSVKIRKITSFLGGIALRLKLK